MKTLLIVTKDGTEINEIHVPLEYLDLSAEEKAEIQDSGFTVVVATEV